MYLAGVFDRLLRVYLAGGIRQTPSCVFSRMYSTNFSCIFSGCVRLYLVVVFDRLLRRYCATSPNLGEEPSYRIGC
ncbi:MAG: hypothetical protein LUD00_09375 [Prevotellaceae bacterium]|nr:hypothetical protein [Prevotellaceae bacterium]